MAKKKAEKPQPKPVEPIVKPVAETHSTKVDHPKPWYLQAKNHFMAAAMACFLGIMLISSQTGINADDRYHVPYTKFFADYFTSFGKDTMYRQIPLDEFWKARVMFDMVNYGIAHGVLGFDPGTPRKIGNKYPPFVYADEGYHIVRHYLIGIVAFIGLLFAGLIGVKFKGWHFGALVMGLMMISPTFIGHAGMNPRDIPFFAWSMIAIYFMVIFVIDFPKVKWSTVMGIALGVALALNVRNGGFLIFAYFGLFAVCIWAYHLFILKDKNVKTVDLFIKGCASFAVAYVAGLIFWPYGQTDAVNIPIFVDLLSSQKYPITLRQLFEGTLISSGDLPWYYQTKLLIITAPLLVLIGFALFPALIYFNRKKVDWKLLLVVLFCAFFPIVYIIRVDANVHTGWRHVIFCYPFLMILTAMGWEFLTDLHHSIRYKIGIYALMAILSIEPVMFTFGNLPHLYVYFNPLVGGNKGSWGDYEYDYWSVSLTEGGRWLKKNVIDKNSPKDTVLVTSNMWDSFGPLLKKELKSGNVKEVGTKIYTRSREDWDYALYYAAFLEPELLKNPNYWPLKGTVKVIEAGGAPIGIVVKRDPEKNDYKGFKALEAKDFPKAIELFKKSLVYDAYNEDVYRALGEAYLNLGMVNEGVQQFRSALSISPNDRTTVGQLGNIYMSLNRFNDVINLYGPWSDSKDPNQQLQALQEIGKAYQAAGDINNANIYFQRAQEAYNAYVEKEGGAQ